MNLLWKSREISSPVPVDRLGNFCNKSQSIGQGLESLSCDMVQSAGQPSEQSYAIIVSHAVAEGKVR